MALYSHKTFIKYKHIFKHISTVCTRQLVLFWELGWHTAERNNKTIIGCEMLFQQQRLLNSSHLKLYSYQKIEENKLTKLLFYF